MGCRQGVEQKTKKRVEIPPRKIKLDTNQEIKLGEVVDAHYCYIHEFYHVTPYHCIYMRWRDGN